MDNIQSKDSMCGSCGNTHCFRHSGKVKVLGMILLAIIIMSAILRDRIVSQVYNSVTINGEGRVQYEPDIAKISLVILVDRVQTASEAIESLNTAVSKAIPALQSLGVKPENIKTEQYSLYPEYETSYQPAPYDTALKPYMGDQLVVYPNIAPINTSTKISGYSARQKIVVTIDELENNKVLLSQVLAQAGQNGINQVEGVIFEPSNMADLKQQAVLLALTDAKNKAGVTAQAAGVKLGRITGWWENYSGPVMPYANYGMGGGEMGVGGGASPMVPSGTQEVIVQIGLTYKLK